MKISITKHKILGVEGVDEEKFFEALFKHLHITDVQIINLEGKSNFKSSFDLLNTLFRDC
jgi:hypothetical protein